MGFRKDGVIWVDTRFSSAFGLVTHQIGQHRPCRPDRSIRDPATRLAAGIANSDETGWAATAAAKREFGPFTGVLEVLRVSSKRPFRAAIGEDPRQVQTQVQANLRVAF